MNYPAFQKEVKDNKFRDAYLFVGKEDFLAESGIKLLVDKLIPPEDRSMNYSLYYGDDAESLPDNLYSRPMFGQKKVTVVKKAQNLDERQIKAVAKFLQSPPSDGHLILWTGEIDKRKKFYKDIAKLIEPINCNPLRQKELAVWINNYTRQYKKKFDEEAMARLSVINWPNLRELASEIDRLSLMVGDEPVIKVQDVEEMGGGSFAFDRWTLTDAIGEGDRKTAHEAVRRLSLAGLKPLQAIGDLFRLFRILWVVKWFVMRKQLAEAKEFIGLPPFVFNRYMNFARKLDKTTIEKALLRILEADLNIKRGLRKDDLELSVLVEYLAGIAGKESKKVRK